MSSCTELLCVVTFMVLEPPTGVRAGGRHSLEAARAGSSLGLQRARSTKSSLMTQRSQYHSPSFCRNQRLRRFGKCPQITRQVTWMQTGLLTLCSSHHCQTPVGHVSRRLVPFTFFNKDGSTREAQCSQPAVSFHERVPTSECELQSPGCRTAVSARRR